jgi:group I intron endonuclease
MKNNNNNFTPATKRAVYENADTPQNQILFENKGKSGIYLFRNSINGNKYIGSSNNFKKRFLQYFNTNYLIRCNYMAICLALFKYGYSKFSLEILEYCEVSELLKREKYYFKLLNPEYNISQEPGSPMLGNILKKLL